MARFIVAIDGAAGSGKSTTAKGVARELGFFYLDTGAMYRAFTLKYLRAEGDEDNIDMKLVRQLLHETTIDLRQDNGKTRVYLDNEDVTLAIRTPEVSNYVSQISALPEVRKAMVARQRAVAEGRNVVCEGRDIGTVVFPDAQVKIFMEAALKTRTERRAKELAEKKIGANMSEIMENLQFRDNYDSQRQHSPLKKAEDAISLDTTNLTIEQEIEVVTKIIEDRMTQKGR
jgi:cytidylate kinase